MPDPFQPARQTASSFSPAAEDTDRLHASMVQRTDIWTEEEAAEAPADGRSPCEGPVPAAILENRDRTCGDLMWECEKRAIKYGENDSLAAIRASLFKFNHSQRVL